PERMVALHLLDSLVVHQAIQTANNLIDVGTGPGLPGIILAIMNPDKRFTLLDSNGKKTRFLFQVKTELKLTNVTIVNDRVEAYHPAEPFDMIVSRAFASLADMTRWCQHLRAADGCFLAMKGQFPQDELDAISDDYELLASQALQVPDVEGQRHLLTLMPK
ncbi:MAG: 16S rRNA (guanine(527)-N(7))-methyltransferase RsmG, partial [Oleibacter sp.]|nr:16S rRNA (guanine(527)-N(7))-methyltransferase RsmG [Thalassolituus sp.]